MAGGTAERLELTISNAAERLRVWWSEADEDAGPSQHLAKGVIDQYEENKPEGTVENWGSRPIYLVLSDKDRDYRDSHYIRVLDSGSAYTGYVDGVVDLVGKVVCKKGESADLIFTGENKFDRQRSYIENTEGLLKRQAFSTHCHMAFIMGVVEIYDFTMRTVN